jgi:hypothetical protein
VSVVADVRALTFDVFGTVVDWRSSLIREGQALAAAKGLGHVDWAKFADGWRFYQLSHGHGVRGPGRQRRARRSPGGGRSRAASDNGRSVANAPLSFLCSARIVG